MKPLVTLVLATTVAILLIPHRAWGHRFPALTTVVVQVEDCGVTLLIGWRPASGLPSNVLLGQATSTGAANQPDALRQQLAAMALSSLAVVVDGNSMQPQQMEAMLSLEESSSRPVVLLLASYPIKDAAQLKVTLKDPKTSRISWLDKSAGRIEIGNSPAQQQWFEQVASFLLYLSAANQVGDIKCSIASLLPLSPLSLSAPAPSSVPAATTSTKKTIRAIRHRQK